MRHYEIVLVFKPNFDTQMCAIVERYQSIVTGNEGTIHRYEDWGKRNLAYPIKDYLKGHYVLMNVEVKPAVMTRISGLANTNETLLRYLVLQVGSAVTGQSPMLRTKTRPSHPSAKRSPTAEPLESDGVHVANTTESVTASSVSASDNNADNNNVDADTPNTTAGDNT